MLSRAHRLTSTLDYSRVVRRGTRFSVGAVVMHIVRHDAGVASRFGFVVAKSVGNAPTRNLIKRRLKMLARPLVGTLHGDVVIRALPSAATRSWDDLSSDLARCVERIGTDHA